MSESKVTTAAGPAAGLTERQRTILDVIRASVTSRGYPPSIREIGDAVGLTSTSSVAHQLRTLERKGYLRRDPNRPRAVDQFFLEREGRHLQMIVFVNRAGGVAVDHDVTIVR